MRKLFLILCLLSILSAQSIHTEQDEKICYSKFDFADSLEFKSLPINDVIINIAKSFIGTEYEAHTLRNKDKEKLKIHLSGLDCYTFLETSLAFSRLIKKGKNTFEDFENEILNIRYRDGKLTDYSSRLHYFSDWLFDVSDRGIIKLITNEKLGIQYPNVINFMSTHPKAYPELETNPDLINKIIDIENKISARKYFYIPQDNIKEYEKYLMSGDLIGLTTDIKGLDIVHVGMAFKLDSGRIHFLHAPTPGKKVQITKTPLAEYIKKNKSQTGIMVARPLEP